MGKSIRWGTNPDHKWIPPKEASIKGGSQGGYVEVVFKAKSPKPFPKSLLTDEALEQFGLQERER